MNIMPRRRTKGKFNVSSKVTPAPDPEPDPIIEEVPHEKVHQHELLKPTEPVQHVINLSSTVDDSTLFNNANDIDTDDIDVVEPVKKTKKQKKILSQKQIDHLARCRAIALEKKMLKTKERNDVKNAKKALKEAQKAQKELDKKTIQDRRKAELAAERKRKQLEKKQLLMSTLDEWYEKKQTKKQLRKAQAQAQPKAQQQVQVQPKVQQKVQVQPQRQTVQPVSKYSPFTTTYTNNRGSRFGKYNNNY